MLTTIFMAVAQNVILGWLWRRLQELVGWAAGLVPLFMMLPPEYQGLVMGVLQGQGGGYSISVYFGFAVYLISQWQSFRSTVVPQVVTSSGQKITPKPDSVAMERVETQSKAAPKRETLWERFGPK